ncbi:hypothetical protein J7F02_09900 [Streptomyces sp. ISL-112]|uniref:DUF7848 domain-containing protein n=1 Tax=unclassified Streptomyces TaxID=2593676 RepID=UPI001BE8A4A3|nr:MULTISPECIES: hypothetical protein [unclassified Streptomyces]MBT2425981.1 hypothetical protein [Streptomyces sp. ISL-112]MBT2465363.1 hypothetical protein [Streptomyces sp. ISL-63]
MPDATNADAPARGITRGRYRFRVPRDHCPRPPALLAFAALCVTGAEHNCGATSGTLHAPDELTRWIAGHCVASGHQHYEQTVRAVLRAEPGAWQ